MTDKKIVAAATSAVVIGVLAYLGYKVYKEIRDIDIDFMGENIDDEYNYRKTDYKA